MSASYPPQRLAETVHIQDQAMDLAAPPAALVVHEHLGLITASAVDGHVVYRTQRGTLFETRAVKTPGGDYLLMFPTKRPEQSRRPLSLWPRRPQGERSRGTPVKGSGRNLAGTNPPHRHRLQPPRLHPAQAARRKRHPQRPHLLFRHATNLGPPHHEARPARKTRRSAFATPTTMDTPGPKSD